MTIENNRKAKASNTKSTAGKAKAKKPLAGLFLGGVLFLLLAVLCTSHYGGKAESPASSGGETPFTEAETVTDSDKADTNARKPQALGEHPKPVVTPPQSEVDGSHPQAAQEEATAVSQRKPAKKVWSEEEDAALKKARERYGFTRVEAFYSHHNSYREWVMAWTTVVVFSIILLVVGAVGSFFFQTDELKGSGGLVSFIIIFTLLLLVFSVSLFWEDLWEKNLPSIFITETGLLLVYKEKEQQSGGQYILFKEIIIISFSLDVWEGTSILDIIFFEREGHSGQLGQVVIREDGLASKKDFQALKGYIVGKVKESNTGRGEAERAVISL